MLKRKIVISVTGASGSIYAKVLFDKLLRINNQIEKIGIIMSDNAKTVWKHELDTEDYANYPFQFYDKNDFMAPFASGSAQFIFTESGTGCVSDPSTAVTVLIKPVVQITGSNAICAGSTTTLSPTSGGSWQSKK